MPSLKNLLARIIAGTEMPAPLRNYHMTEEGIIVEDPSGYLIRWQAGGCSCAHPERVGFLYECSIPEQITREVETFFCHEGRIVNAFAKNGFEVEIGYSVMEAWLPLRLKTGRDIVLVWNNSD